MPSCSRDSAIFCDCLVFRVPETATILMSGGISFGELNQEQVKAMPLLLIMIVSQDQRYCYVIDSATWYSTNTCSTLPRFNCENGLII
jgi:hypothetical protein